MCAGAPRARGGALLLMLLVAARAAGQQLPDLPLDTFPPVSREPIARALADARAHPGDGARAGALGRLLQAWEQWDAAAAAYARARALDARWEWRYLGGIVEARLARHARAAELFAQVVEEMPGHVPALLRLGDAQLEVGQGDAARRAYTAALAEPAAVPHARYGLGRVLAAEGRHDEALRELDEALRLAPEFAAAWYARGLSARRVGQLDAARDALAKARQHGAWWPAVPDPVLAGVTALRDDPVARLQRGLALEREGDLEGALREHLAAVTANPALTQAHVNLIALYGRRREWARAEAHYREAVRLEAPGAEAHYNAGIVFMLQGREAEAATALEEAVRVNPQHAAAWNNLGQYAERTGRLTEAIVRYRQAVAHAPMEHGFRFNLGRLLIATRAWAEAIAQFERLAATDSPDRARYMHGLATALVLSGDLRRGRDAAREARDLAAAAGQAELAAAIEQDLARLPQ